MQIPDIKKHLPISVVLAHYGIKPDKNNHIKCPFHADDKPSMKIYTDTNTYNCFGCGKTGDVIQFIQDKEASTGSVTASKHQALKIATELVGEIKSNNIESSNVMGIALKKETATETEDFAELFEKQKASLPRSSKAQHYLKERGLLRLRSATTSEILSPSKVEVGYNSRAWNKLRECIIFPLKDRNGNITSLYGRRITEPKSYNAEAGKHYYTANRKGLYPGYPPQKTKTLIITEAIIDCASLQLLMVNDELLIESVSMLSAYGTNGLTTEHTEAVSQLQNLHEIIFFFDGDSAGNEGVLKNTEKLQHLKCKITQVPTPDGEDINSLFVNYGKEAILQLIEERQPVGMERQPINKETSFSTEKDIIEKEIKVQAQCIAFQQLNIDTPNKIIHETQTARYIVKGTLSKQLDKMLVSLDVQHLETAVKYRCRLDLYEEKQARKEAREASEKLDLRYDLVENDLSKLTDLLEEFRDIQLLVVNDELLMEEMPSLAVQAKCKAFLKQNNLIEELNKLVGKSGIVGEENNRLFLFIIATSHKMPDTLHALIQGSSGSGKTHLLSKIASLMPTERVVKFTRVTENSFYNYDEYFFRGKLICLEDIDGLKEEALFAWRELISNNQLSSSTSQKDENGNIRSVQRVVRGPMASICATTHGQIYEDNMSRMFIVAVDESHEQTSKIIEYQSLAASGVMGKDKENEAKEFLQNCIRMLKPIRVINPYAHKIKLPPQAHKIRRLHELFLSFVKQVTLINQYQRQRDKQGRLITEPIDLRVAIEIMFDSIFLKVDELDGSLRQFFENLKEYVLEKENSQNYEFTQREVRQALNLSKTGLFRYLNSLIELEYISSSGGYQNRGLKYRISYWDNVTKLRSEISQYLLNQLDKL